MEYKKRMTTRPRIGQQLGNYRLLSLLGRGNFADVYLGEHIHLNVQASIKVLDMRLTNDDMSDFLTEARTIAHLRHPNITQVLEFGVEGNTPYLVMDYAPNGTLRQRYPAGTRLLPESILPHVKQVASALQYAHNQQIIHRDIKPENMLLGSNQEILLSDFGIAVVANSSRSQSMHGVAGTVAYMAPEQLRGRPIFASDQYSLGVVVYEWLSGSSPFHGSFVEVATQHTQLDPPPLREKGAHVSPALESVVLRAIAKEPQHRFASIQEFATAFEQACTPVVAELAQPSSAMDSTSSAMNPTSSPIGSLIPGLSSDTAPLPTLLPTPELNVLPLQETTITIYRGHTGTVNAVAWSPSETQQTIHYRSRIASASDDGTVQIWDATTGRKASTYRGHSGAVSALAWSHDGKRMASAGIDSTVQVWDAANMHRICIYRNHTEKVSALAWSPDEPTASAGQGPRIASASVDGTVQIWEIPTGHRLSIYRGHTQAVHALAWSPDGQYIASAGDDMTVQVWLVNSGNTVFTNSAATHEVLALGWSPDGQYIASGGAEQVVHVWEALTGSSVYTYRGHQFTVSALSWSPNGQRIASASFDRTAQIWDATTGANAVSYTGHSNWVYALSWSPDGQRIASASGDKTVQVWLAG